MAAMDTTLPNNNQISRKYNITGFPTLIYFENGVMQYGYPGENNRASLVNFLKNPKPEAEEKPKETEWKDEPSEVHHLTGKTNKQTNFLLFTANKTNSFVCFLGEYGASKLLSVL